MKTLRINPQFSFELHSQFPYCCPAVLRYHLVVSLRTISKACTHMYTRRENTSLWACISMCYYLFTYQSVLAYLRNYTPCNSSHVHNSSSFSIAQHSKIQTHHGVAILLQRKLLWNVVSAPFESHQSPPTEGIPQPLFSLASLISSQTPNCIGFSFPKAPSHLGFAKPRFSGFSTFSLTPFSRPPALPPPHPHPHGTMPQGPAVDILLLLLNTLMVSATISSLMPPTAFLGLVSSKQNS